MGENWGGGGGGTALTAYASFQEAPVRGLLGAGLANTPTSEGETVEGALPLGVLDYLATALSEPTPFTGVVAIDPTPTFDAAGAGLSDFEGAASALSPDTDWADFLGIALANLDDVIQNGANLEASVDAFEGESEPAYLRDLSALLGTLFSTHATESSALLTALATMKRGRRATIEAYRREVTRDSDQRRTVFVLQAIEQMKSMQAMRVEAIRVKALMRQSFEVANYDALRNYNDDQVDLAYRNQVYHMDLFKYGGNILGVSLGAQPNPIGPTRASMALSSAMAGLGTGAQLGAPLGVPAALGLGALFGVAGLGSGLMAPGR